MPEEKAGGTQRQTAAAHTSTLESFVLSTALVLVMSSVGVYLAAAFQPTWHTGTDGGRSRTNASIESLTTDAKVLEVYPSTGVHLLAYRPQLTVFFEVKNTGVRPLRSVRVTLTVRDESLNRNVATLARNVPSLAMGANRRLVFSGVSSNQGSTNSLTAIVKPASGETAIRDNVRTLKYVMDRAG